MRADHIHSRCPTPAWPSGTYATVNLDEAGLALGAGTRLVRFAKGTSRLAVEADRDRLLALLSVASRQPVSVDVLRHVGAAAEHWRRGDKALANLRLIFAGLPHLAEPADAHRLRAAEYLLDAGMSPGELMAELGIVAKYSPDQPRVPAGSGRTGGQWTGESGAEEAGSPAPSVRGRPVPIIIPVAADGPLKPGGMDVVPLPGADALDPQGLNKPLGLEEQQAITDTVNAILLGRPEDVPTLNAHPYKNRRNRDTAAILPPSVGGYTTYYVRKPGAIPGDSRIVMDSAQNIYYTNNHYKSFYPVDIKIRPEH